MIATHDLTCRRLSRGRSLLHFLLLRSLLLLQLQLLLTKFSAPACLERFRLPKLLQLAIARLHSHTGQRTEPQSHAQ
jgi:hypothetical protein